MAAFPLPAAPTKADFVATDPCPTNPSLDDPIAQWSIRDVFMKEFFERSASGVGSCRAGPSVIRIGFTDQLSFDVNNEFCQVDAQSVFTVGPRRIGLKPQAFGS